MANRIFLFLTMIAILLIETVFSQQVSSQTWTWISGANRTNQYGNYGTKGIASSSNIPGARNGAVSWKDSSDNFWLFGGYGYAASSSAFLNDLWKFDGMNWTWISGSNLTQQRGNYGAQGVASSSNIPGGRRNAVSWIDSNNNFWLLGGFGIDATDRYGVLNDLWKYDGENWIWISGANSINQRGIYGTQGIPSSSNFPGALEGAVTWKDSNDNFWLFGGLGIVYFNDLWKFDGVNWTWISGSNSINQNGTYGTKGIASSSNVPGGRYRAVSWKDSSDNFWIFGGYGYAATGNLRYLNDLWKFDGANWTWISGSNTTNQRGNYGTKGIASSSNVPGAREVAVSWIDLNNTLWLFGGNGYATSTLGELNDLWKFDGINWTWISGSNLTNQYGNYGTKGIASSLNIPGARYFAMSWIDSNDTLWLFGGYRYEAINYGGKSHIFNKVQKTYKINEEYLNDLWNYKVSPPVASLTSGSLTSNSLTTSITSTTGGSSESGTSTIRTTSIILIIVGILFLIV